MRLEDQFKANQQDQAHADPHNIDAIPTPPDGQDRRSDHRAEQRSRSIEGVEVIEESSVTRHTCNIGVQPASMIAAPKPRGNITANTMTKGGMRLSVPTPRRKHAVPDTRKGRFPNFSMSSPLLKAAMR